MKRRAVIGALGAVCLALAFFAGCSRSGEGGSPADTLTQRQRDSIAATLPLPGVGAIGKALDASDAAKARAERLDTLLHR